MNSGIKKLIVAGISLLSVILIVSCGREQVKTTPLPEIIRIIPADTLGFIALTDLDAFREDITHTTLNDVWNDPDLKTWRNTTWPKFQSMIEETMENTTLSEIESLFYGDMVMMFTPPPDGTGDKGDEPGMAIVCKTTGNADAFDNFVAEVILPEDPETVYLIENAFRILSNTEALAEEIAENIRSGSAPFSENQHYAQIEQRFDANGFVHMWIDLVGLKKTILEFTSHGEKTDTGTILSAIGFDTLDMFYSSGRIWERGFLSAAALTFTGERDGLFALPSEDAAFKATGLVGPDATMCFAVSHQGVDTLLSVVKNIVEASGGNWQELQNDASAFLGMGLETEFANLWGGEIAFVSYPSFGLSTNMCILIETKDPRQATELIGKMVSSSNISPAAGTYKGVEYHNFFVPPMPFQLTYGSAGDFLVVALQPAAFNKVIDVHQSGTSIEAAEEFTSRLKKLTGSSTLKGNLISFQNPSQQELSSSLTMFLPMMMQGISQETQGKITASDLPNVQSLIKYIESSISMGFAAPNELQYRSYYTFGFSMDASFFIAPILAAIAVPNFLEAQTRSKVARVHADMRSLATAIEMYYVEQNMYPLLATQLTSPVAYITTLPIDPFAPAKGAHLMYHQKEKSWVLIGAGTDHGYDITPETDFQPHSEHPLPVDKTYDPSNGTVSNGDIWRIKQ